MVRSVGKSNYISIINSNIIRSYNQFFVVCNIVIRGFNRSNSAISVGVFGVAFTASVKLIICSGGVFAGGANSSVRTCA